MGIEIAPEENMDCPLIICDWCGEEITVATDGNYEWSLAGGRGVYYTHKACCRAFEDATPHIDWGAQPLECLMVYLANRLHLKAKAAKETAALLASL